tara:strand:- start:513 stop:800 length:288 start_codon:yes stop_codon:yes gene_type:complete
MLMTPNIISKSQTLTFITFKVMKPDIQAWYYPREHNTLDRVRYIPVQQPHTVEYQKYINGSWVSVDFLMFGSDTSVKQFRERMKNWYEEKAFASI